MGAIINTTKEKYVHFYEHLIPFKDGSGRYSGECDGITCAVDDLEGGFMQLNYLKYHSSWKWFMPVWFKFRDQKVPIGNLQRLHHKAICKGIENAILNSPDGTPKKAFEEMVKAVEWLNSLKK